MKKLFLIVACCMAMAACQNTNQSDNSMQSQIDSLQTIVEGKDAELNELVEMVTEVQEGVRRIAEAEGRVTVADGNIESASSREIIRDNMEFISEAMRQNRELVSQLKEKLNASRFKNDKMKSLVEALQSQVEEQTLRIQNLQATIAEKDSTILAQTGTIDTLAQNVAQLKEVNAEQTEKVNQQDSELHAAWFVYGTKRELKEQGILNDGEVLRNGNFNKEYFTQIDIRETQNIKTYSKSARILTTHPSDSYMLSKDGNDNFDLHILNPEKFWSVSKFLVMQVK
ncbi:MAG: hypothetical protein IKU79_07555 [Bacteroidaceae bacterium]|nr:hypothetical protein [Bacteroidaceae bacterium]